MRKVTILAIAMVIALALMQGGSAAPKAQKVTLEMGEYYFRPKQVTLTAGVPAEIVLVNKGKVTHEFMVYALPKPGIDMDELHEWAEEQSYFKDLEVKVETSEAEVEGMGIFEVEVKAGKKAEVKFTPRKKGTFEIGCLLPDHYERGMKGTLVVK
ncbi:MAG: cupredoxin domain-containing protein [Armatimonadota bacterium]|nr:cupredoxin domain-containing protein [Armatimonadota bacterium]MDR5702259.1 cupredoxin domain-containing protein [Armatimonadota bacterium]MDR7434553.1 cupredoxin domain-containing protein [Armatimonadota bacterium]